ncbi:E3 ubiquitin-protein ligase rnf8-A-like [Daphnia carinata]|uniref:E3 ubiquitin-protein ligase rnf8-A-like n=1 Tax=Daphnia carinata TaxID=120202 RepID=UPI00257BE482|nr:E3 ubiquitin-protein ligase rnf8-A-like [Daphnia carinata]
MGKQARERQLELEKKVLKLIHREKELRITKDQTLAKLRYKCELLTRINELRQEQFELMQEKFNLALTMEVEAALQSRLEQINEEQKTVVNTQVDIVKEDAASAEARNISCQDIAEKMQRMDKELSCGICSELIIFATSLNCMHTFCQYCVTQWKSFEKNRAPVISCPVCREPIVSEKRNFSIDNIVGIMVEVWPEEEKNNRKDLVKQHQELTRNLLSGLRQPGTTNPFYQITNRNVYMGEMQIEDLPTRPATNLQNVPRRRTRSATSSRPTSVRRLQTSARPRWR